MEQIAKGIWKLSYGKPEEHTPVSMRKTKMCFNGLEQVGKMPEENMPAVVWQLEYQARRRGVTVTCPMDSDEDIYGFGLQLLSVNYAGRRRYTKVNSDPRMDTGESHAPVPFYISTAGYGLFVDTYRYVTFSMGTNAEKGASAQKKEVNQPHKEFSESALYALKRSNETRKIEAVYKLNSDCRGTDRTGGSCTGYRKTDLFAPGRKNIEGDWAIN